ncbi:MAG: hypothetical protein KAT25_05525 [Sulfuriflexus sp.]|nr:hypothetical protein [Sulfuriflexus sp.]
MAINSVLSTGVQGIQRGLSGAREHAQQVASFGTTNQDASVSSLAEPLIGLRQDLAQVQASAKVVSTVDELLNSLLEDLS